MKARDLLSDSRITEQEAGMVRRLIDRGFLYVRLADRAPFRMYDMLKRCSDVSLAEQEPDVRGLFVMQATPDVLRPQA